MPCSPFLEGTMTVPTQKQVGSIQDILPERSINEFFRDVDNEVNMNVDGSVLPALFSWVAPIVPPEFVTVISSLSLIITDTLIQSDKFGGIMFGLSNGVTLDIVTSRNRFSWFKKPVQINAEFSLYTNAGANSAFIDDTKKLLSVTIEFRNAGYQMIFQGGDSFVVGIHDDLTPLDSMIMLAHGLIRGSE